ncbi:hypothetical protein [Brachyspira sp.]|uniref:hypothetical protein n=1 Tax=Brachyspira sp. TaxID=1977261 RepID=UPI002624DDE9|nr:hypothetical protein [Brachyspira sp.]
MYPTFSKVIATENNKNVTDLINRTTSVKKTHSELYTKVMYDLNAKKTLPTVYYLYYVFVYIESGVH